MLGQRDRLLMTDLYKNAYYVMSNGSLWCCAPHPQAFPHSSIPDFTRVCSGEPVVTEALLSCTETTPIALQYVEQVLRPIPAINLGVIHASDARLSLNEMIIMPLAA